jgi:hypothetical protein
MPRPFSVEYVPYNWRGFLDYGTSQIGNWATHTAGPAAFSLQLGAPTAVECVKIEGKSEITYPDRCLVRLDFPARGEMPAVQVFYHDSVRPQDAEAYHVPGMENEVILPPANNLSDKGRPMGRGAAGGTAATGRGAAGGRGGTANVRTGGGATPPDATPPAAAPAAARPRQGAGGPGVAVYGPGSSPAQRGILSGHGSVIVGTKGMIATVERGEGVWLLPNSRWQEYVLPPQLLTRSPGHMLDWIRACKGGDPSCSDFSVTAPFAEWLALTAIAMHVPGKLEWDSKNVRFTNSPEGNKWVKPYFRKGWELKL